MTAVIARPDRKNFECTPRSIPEITRVHSKPRVATSRSNVELREVASQTCRRLVALANPDVNRPVDARWQIAGAIVERAAPRTFFKRVDDANIDEAVEYLSRLRACRTDVDRERVRQRTPHLQTADDLKHGRDKMSRGLLEARLLAGQTVEEVARACVLPDRTVCIYESLFFAVSGRRHHRHYLACEAIGPKAWNGLTSADTDVILKLAGFHGGVSLIEQVVDYYSYGPTLARSPESLSLPELRTLGRVLDTEAYVLLLLARLQKTRLKRVIARRRKVWKRIHKITIEMDEPPEPLELFSNPEHYKNWFESPGVQQSLLLLGVEVTPRKRRRAKTVSKPS